MKQDKTKNEFFEKVKSISQNATTAVIDMASDIVENTRDMATSTVDKVNAAIEKRKRLPKRIGGISSIRQFFHWRELKRRSLFVLLVIHP